MIIVISMSLSNTYQWRYLENCHALKLHLHAAIVILKAFKFHPVLFSCSYRYGLLDSVLDDWLE